MERLRRSRLAGLFRRKMRSSRQGSHTRSAIVGQISEQTAEHPESVENQRNPPMNEEEYIVSGLANDSQARDTQATDGVIETRQESAERGAAVQEVSEQDATGQQRTEASDKSPIWTKSMELFSKEKPDLYELMDDRVKEIRNLDVDNWDTWLNRQSKETQKTWFRRCKSYLPPLKTAKSLAVSLSNLDPHRVPPYVTTGAFVLIGVGHASKHSRENGIAYC
ncbi:hypothetical protein GGR54DRAFT_606114 [Hypoxylon sp. NC1633]|nr:hypothetical protein GGR54DRAFT_606114 [Hypoxylon sp. NC1633]